MEEKLAADIEAIVADQDILKEPITDARRSKIQGQGAQTQIADLLDSHDSLFRICEYEYKQRRVEDSASIVTVSEELVSEGYIESKTRKEFLELWDEISWIIPALGIPTKNLGGLEEHWSDIGLTPKSDQPELFEYTIYWGVDEQIDANIPGSRIVERALLELNMVSTYLKMWQNDDDLDDEMVSYLAEEYDIGWAEDMLRNILADFEAIEHEGGGLSNGSKDPKLEVTWDDGSGHDDVVGAIRVTPPGEQVVKADDDGPDTPPRGFQ